MSTVMVAYGARCTWWDAKSNAATIPSSGLPCCPFCGGVLFETDAASWRSDAEAFAERSDDEGYVRFVDWLRGRDCREFVGGLAHARAVFDLDAMGARILAAPLTVAFGEDQ